MSVATRATSPVTPLSLVVLAVSCACAYHWFAIHPKNQCTMSYSRPAHKAVLENVSGFPETYRLVEYMERRAVSRKNNDIHLVLFLHGNAGSYLQVRSIASRLLKLKNPMDNVAIFSLDFHEEYSAASGDVLQLQTDFVVLAVDHIMKQYSNSGGAKTVKSVLVLARSMGGMVIRATTVPWGLSVKSITHDKETVKSVSVFAHSMGGIVIRAAALEPKFPSHLLRAVITLGTPHRSPPVLLDTTQLDFYERTNRGWGTSDALTAAGLEHAVLVSVAGGSRDILIEPRVTSLEGIVPTGRYVSLLSRSVARCGLDIDHQCLLWCSELVEQVALAIAETIGGGPHGSDSHGALQEKLARVFGGNQVEATGEVSIKVPSAKNTDSFASHKLTSSPVKLSLDPAETGRALVVSDVPLEQIRAKCKGKEVPLSLQEISVRASGLPKNIALLAPTTNEHKTCSDFELKQRGGSKGDLISTFVFDSNGVTPPCHPVEHGELFTPPVSGRCKLEIPMSFGSKRKIDTVVSPLASAFAQQAAKAMRAIGGHRLSHMAKALASLFESGGSVDHVFNINASWKAKDGSGDSPSAVLAYVVTEGGQAQQVLVDLSSGTAAFVVYRDAHLHTASVVLFLDPSFEYEVQVLSSRVDTFVWAVFREAPKIPIYLLCAALLAVCSDAKKRGTAYGDRLVSMALATLGVTFATLAYPIDAFYHASATLICVTASTVLCSVATNLVQGFFAVFGCIPRALAVILFVGASCFALPMNVLLFLAPIIMAVPSACLTMQRTLLGQNIVLLSLLSLPVGLNMYVTGFRNSVLDYIASLDGPYSPEFSPTMTLEGALSDGVPLISVFAAWTLVSRVEVSQNRASRRAVHLLVFVMATLSMASTTPLFIFVSSARYAICIVLVMQVLRSRSSRRRKTQIDTLKKEA